MHIFRRDKKDEKDVEAIDFFRQVAQWRAPASQPPPATQPAPSPQPATQGPPPAQPAPAPTQGPTAPPQPVAQPQAAPAPRLATKSPFEELLELARTLNIDLKPLEELRVFAQGLDSKIAELEREASRLEGEARERRRAAELLRRLREQIKSVGV